MSGRALSPEARAVLARHRLGSVPYLNARPLVDPLPGPLMLEVPAVLTQRFEAGELDAALLPAFAALSRREAWIADGVAIASRGEVYSVFLAHREPISALESVALDPASRTSSHLLQCVLANFHGVRPRYAAAPESPTQARLLIGDAAIAFRSKEREGWQFLDLGAEWMRGTGLPFVFACWVLRPGLAEAPALAAALREAKRVGLDARDGIAAASEDAAFTRRYLTEWIRYDLGADERTALERFGGMLSQQGFVEGAAELRFV